MGVQFHPEFKSTPWDGHPLFNAFVKAALEHQGAGKNKNLKISRTPGMGNRFAFVAHTDKDPYANKDLMLALKYGIDRKKIVQNVFSGYASVGNDHTVGPKMKFFDTKQKQVAYDPDKAKFHFKKANISAPLELQVSEGAFSGATDSGQVFQ